jgi:hypothetical protein
MLGLRRLGLLGEDAVPPEALQETISPTDTDFALSIFAFLGNLGLYSSIILRCSSPVLADDILLINVFWSIGDKS